MRLETPAVNRERDKPITPSPVIDPRPVSQALKTKRSMFSSRSRISPEVSNPLLISVLLGSGARAIAPGVPNPLKSSRSPWVAKWAIRVVGNCCKM